MKKGLSIRERWRRTILSKDGPKMASTRLVLLALSKHMMANGTRCYPSTRLLKEETGLNRSTVLLHLAKAQEEGWLEILERQKAAPGGQSWKRNYYLPRFPKVVGSPDQLKPSKVVGSLDQLPSEGGRIDRPRPENGTWSDQRTKVVGSPDLRKEERQEGMHERDTSNQPSRTPPVTRGQEEKKKTRRKAGGKKREEIAGLIREIWHLGSDTIERDGKELGIGLELSIFDTLQERYPETDLLEALAWIRRTQQFDEDEPISLRVWEQRPQVLHECIAASQKHAAVPDIVRRMTEGIG